MAPREILTDLTVTRAAVGALGRELGRGGQARVYLAPSITLPDAPGRLVYKEYKTSAHASHGLSALVAERNRLDTAARCRLDARTCWPLRVVEDAGKVRGVLLPLIPPSFVQERVLPGTRTLKQSVREIQHMLVDPATTRRLGMPCPTQHQRLIVCRDFAAAVHMVHRMGLVVGDINPRNALYRVPDRPAVMLLDCDGIRKVGSVAALPQLNAPDWFPPEGQSVLSLATDRYKLGLFVLRCLSPGPLASISRNPTRADAALNAEGSSLLRAALSPVPGDRPTAQVWGRYLDRRIGVTPGVARQPPIPFPVSSDVLARAPRGRRRDATGKWQQVD